VSTGFRGSNYRWQVVGLLWWVCFFNYADRQAIYSVFPLLQREFHLTNVQLGVVGSAFMWMYALAGPFAGWLCDRWPRKRIIVVALVFWSGVTALNAYAGDYRALVLLRTLGGLGEAFYFPAALSLLGDFHPGGTRSRAMSIHQSSVYIGTIAGGGIAAWVAERHGWQQSFLFFGAGGIALGAVLVFLLKEPQRQVEPAAMRVEGSLLSGLKEMIHNRAALALIGIFTGANFVASAFLTWLPTFLYQKFQLTLAVAGFSATAYMQLASVVGVLVGGLLADRFVRSMRGGRMLTQGIGMLCGSPFLLWSGCAASLPLLVSALLCFGFCKGLYDANIWASLYDTIPAHRRGFAAGLMNSIGWLGGGLAPLGIAAATQWVSMGTAISSTAAIYLVLGTAMILLSRSFSETKSVA
jgi:MFS family permease